MILVIPTEDPARPESEERIAFAGLHGRANLRRRTAETDEFVRVDRPVHRQIHRRIAVVEQLGADGDFLPRVADRAEVATYGRCGTGRRCDDRGYQRVLRFLGIVRVVHRQTALQEACLEAGFSFAGLLRLQVLVPDR